MILTCVQGESPWLDEGLLPTQTCSELTRGRGPGAGVQWGSREWRPEAPGKACGPQVSTELLASSSLPTSRRTWTWVLSRQSSSLLPGPPGPNSQFSGHSRDKT